MRTTFCLILVLALLMGMPVIAPAEDRKDEAKADQFLLYRIAGRTWTIRRIPKDGNEGGPEGTSYLVHEVLGVWDKHAEVTQHLQDSTRKAAEDAGAALKVNFEANGIIFRDPAGFKKVRDEKLEVSAGTFDCARWQSTMDGGATMWLSTLYPSLVVKSEDRFSTRELIEFDFVEGEPGYKAPRDQRKRNASKVPEDAKELRVRLFGSKGACWVHHITRMRGPLRLRSFEVKQFAIAKADGSSCTLEITPLTQELRKLKGAEVEKFEIDFESQLNEWLEPRRRYRTDRKERRLTKAGLFDCTVYSFTNEDGLECLEWYADEWPGLVVRRVVKGKEFEEVTALVKFEN